jgi:penicillin-binding protein 2
MIFWTPKTRIDLNDSSNKSALDGNFGEFLEQKNKTIFLKPVLGGKKIYFIAGIFAAVFLIFIFRTAYIQIIRGAYYRDLAENNRIRTYIIPSYRGIIYDRNNVPLVKNKPISTLSLIPKKLPADTTERDNFLQNVADIIKMPKENIEATLIDYQSYSEEAVLICNNLSHEALLSLSKYSLEYPAVVITEQTQREYTGNVLSLSHILGYTGSISKDEYEKRKNKGYYLRDYIGKTGVEIFYEETLRGKFGKKQIEIDAFGQEKRIIAKEEASPGKDLILTIDVEVQSQLEKIIKEYLKKYNKKCASAVLMNPKNGEILAMVSLPAFSNNEFAGGISKESYKKLNEDPDYPLINRTISGEYPSGSVIKPLWAAAALEEGIISPNTAVLSVGGIRVGNWFFPDWKAGGHGLTNVTKALAESINTFFYYIGGGFGDFKGLGLDKMIKYATIFGMGEKTEIDLPFEKEGFLPSESWKISKYGQPWYIGDTYHLAIGQGYLLVTPMQIAVLTAAVANGGDLIVPHVLKEIVNGSQIEEIPMEFKKQNFVKPENLEVVKGGMREAVTRGSAALLSGLGVQMAGKTGTAQLSENRTPHAWFTGFFPYQDPEMVITVLVEEGGEGSKISTQIVRDFVEWYTSKKLTQNLQQQNN